MTSVYRNHTVSDITTSNIGNVIHTSTFVYGLFVS